jgi:acetylornithine aminotransferase
LNYYYHNYILNIREYNNWRYKMKLFIEPEIKLTAVSSSGTKILTREKGELIDLESGCWAAVLGHCRKDISAIICENSASLFHTHQFFNTEHPDCLSLEITEASGLHGRYTGSYMTSGTEAVSLAVKLSEIITNRCKKLSFNVSYLGSSPDLRMPRDPNLWLDLDISECIKCKKNAPCSDCGKFDSINFSDTAAFVFEPGNSGGLVLLPPQKLIEYISVQVKNAGGLIIANEVTTGFGRTGKWFGFQHYDILNTEAFQPDLISMGKGLGNGYPVSGVLVKDKYEEIIKKSGFRYVQSHIDDPLGCIVGRKVVNIMVRENLIEKGRITGEYLRSKLKSTAESTDLIDEIRGVGMMNTIVLKNNYKAKDVFGALLNSGFFVGYSEAFNLIRLYPPLVLSREEADKFCESLLNILQ